IRRILSEGSTRAAVGANRRGPPGSRRRRNRRRSPASSVVLVPPDVPAQVMPYRWSLAAAIWMNSICSASEAGDPSRGSEIRERPCQRSRNNPHLWSSKFPTLLIKEGVHMSETLFDGRAPAAADTGPEVTLLGEGRMVREDCWR